MADKNRKRETGKKSGVDLNERSPELKGDLEARPDELGRDSRQVGFDSAGQSGDSQQLSIVEDANEESVEELAEASSRSRLRPSKAWKTRRTILSARRIPMKNTGGRMTFRRIGSATTRPSSRTWVIRSFGQ